jgi:hypothetical protein
MLFSYGELGAREGSLLSARNPNKKMLHSASPLGPLIQPAQMVALLRQVLADSSTNVETVR